jgi:hypothetical protein
MNSSNRCSERATVFPCRTLKCERRATTSSQIPGMRYRSCRVRGRAPKHAAYRVCGFCRTMRRRCLSRAVMREPAAVITGTTRIDAACRGALRMVDLWVAVTAGQDLNGVSAPTGASTPARLHGTDDTSPRICGPRLRSVWRAGSRDGLALENRARKQEQCHVGASPRTEHREEPQTRSGQIEQTRIAVSHQLIRAFRGRIQGYRMRGRFKHRIWQLRAGPINRAGGRVYEVRDAVVAATLEHVERADDVALDISVWCSQRMAYPGLSGQMHDPVEPGNNRSNYRGRKLRRRALSRRVAVAAPMNPAAPVTRSFMDLRSILWAELWQLRIEHWSLKIAMHVASFPRNCRVDGKAQRLC